MLFFALLFSMVGIFASVIMKTDCAQLSSLLKSDYIYSATTEKPAFKDDYFQFDAGISYMLSADAQKSLNAEILMQSADSDYTNLLEWNIEELSTRGIAITEGLAKKNNLKIGDKLYSKHIVDGTVYEYIVEQILPELTSARVTSTRGYSRGVIIMGYDSQYTDNIAHRSVVFTKESIDDLTARVSGMPMNIVYRSDEIEIVLIKLLPYYLLFVLLAVIITSALTLIIKKNVQYNFKRLMILGFGEKGLNSVYYGIICSIGISSIIIAAVIAFVFSQLFVFSFAEAVVLFILTIIELATLFVSARLSKRQLWR